MSSALETFDGQALVEHLSVARRDLWTHTNGNKAYKEPTAPTQFPVELPESWGMASLEAVTHPVRVICYGILMPKEHVADGVPYVKVRDIKHGKINVSGLNRTSPEIAAKYARSTLCEGDIVLAIRGTYGRVAVVPGEIDGANITQDSARIAPLEGIDRDYLALYLASPIARRYYDSVARGVAVKGVNIADVRALPVPVPPLAVQRAIVRAIQRQVRGIERGLETLEIARRNLRLMRATVLSRVAPFDSSAETQTLDQLLERIEAGKSFQCEQRPAEYGEWGVIKVSAMTWGQFNATENKALPQGREPDPRWEIRPGDVLMSRANTTEYVGATVFVRETPRRLLLSDKSLRLVPREGVDPEWLQLALSAPSLRRQISAMATGTSDSMRNISQGKIRGLELPVLDVDLQRRRASEARHALDAIGRLEDDLARAEASAAVLERTILWRGFTAGLTVAEEEEPDFVESAV